MMPGMMMAGGVMAGMLMPGMGIGGAAGMMAPAAVKQERTILLKNMFAPEDAKADEDFEEELSEDVRGECEKFGKIVHIKVDKVLAAAHHHGR